ncbi:MAG TPA: hypothetical protein VK177_05875 [Flavobacteriales bacterium]|nr:hypothetical protein [Flavobacteriales bacterium]
MKTIIKQSLILTLLFTFAAPVYSQTNLQFASNEREDGTAFFSLDGNTGQVYFMLDYGTNAGNWKAYGTGIADLNGGFLFSVSERKDGTAFFAMNRLSGQVYFMLDYGDYAGTWKSYGGNIPSKSRDGYTFDANERSDGTAFFSQDKSSGQTYYMLDYGDNAGIWKAFGQSITK